MVSELKKELDLERARCSVLLNQIKLLEENQVEIHNNGTYSKKRELSFSGELVNSDVEEFKKEMINIKNGGLLQEENISKKENNSKTLLGIFEPELTHSHLLTPKKLSPEAVDFMKSDEGSPRKGLETLDLYSSLKNEDCREKQQEIKDLQRKYDEMKLNYEEMVDEFCKVKVEKLNIEREMVDILNCVENLSNFKNVPCSIVRESALGISDKNLERLKGYFKEKNFIL